VKEKLFVHNLLTDGGEISLTRRPPLPPGRFPILIFVRDRVDPRAVIQLEELVQLKKSSDLIGNRTRDLQACSIGAQPTTLPRVNIVADISTVQVFQIYILTFFIV
jgi:hypothetical protein